MKEEKPQKIERPGGEPFRISIYVYPNQMEWIEKMVRARGITKRTLFFEMVHMAIQDFKSGRHLS